VVPPGEATSRRTARVSPSRAASSAADPAIVSTTSCVATGGVSPRFTAASTIASATTAM
jgi:hypothetical protein